MHKKKSTLADLVGNLSLYVQADDDMKIMLVVVGVWFGLLLFIHRVVRLDTPRQSYKKDSDKRGIMTADGCSDVPLQNPYNG